MTMTDNDDKNLPNFLKESAPDNNSTSEQKVLPAPRSLKKVLILISAAWLLLIFFYVHFFFGWASLSVLLPGEFVFFAAGIFITLAVMLLMAVYIYRTVLSISQSETVERSLNEILYAGNKNALSDILSPALLKQIQQLTDTANNLSRQTVSLKQELSAKADDFSTVSSVLENCFKQNLQKLDDGTAQLINQCQNAAETAEKTAEKFAAHAENLKTSAQALNDELNPLINETLLTAEHLQSVAVESKNQMQAVNADMNSFSLNEKKLLEDMAETLCSHSSKLEKTFLQTADNCEEIYKRLDGGISHIENSLNTHKQLAQEQSALIDKNSSYLDNKLGEYGRLISLEVEAMVERASQLDMNVKTQLNTLSGARDKIDQILDGANNSLEQKSDRAVRNIEKIVANLDNELNKLNDFIKRTDSKNSEIQTVAEKITRKIGDISVDLGLKVDDLKNRAIEAIDKFNEVSGVVQSNTTQLTETANIIVSKGKEGAESLENQYENISRTVQELENVKNKLSQIGTGLGEASTQSSQVFDNYKRQIEEFGHLIHRQVELLDESQNRSETHFYSVKKQYEELSLSNFMDESAALIEKLENIAVDLNRFFNGDDDELWKKFYSGDHAVFARNIVKNLNRKQIVKVREEYENNLDFRQLCDRYLSEYEILLNAAQKSEKPQILLAMLSGADIGKIYYVTARALDRLE